VVNAEPITVPVDCRRDGRAHLDDERWWRFRGGLFGHVTQVAM